MLLVDQVMVLVGKDKGKISVINDIIKERNWVFVSGLNTVSCELHTTAIDLLRFSHTGVHDIQYH